MSKSPPEPSFVVLVVEDEPLLRLVATDLLQEAGYQVIEAEDATDALTILERTPDIRLLFTDIQMPGPLDGMALAQNVHERWPDVWLLITSGNRRPPAADIPDHGHFIPKPYEASKVLGEIDALAREAAIG
jgi:two-component system, response regulator PdtaR